MGDTDWGNVGQDALQGASTGAAFGSLIPGGTAIGAGIGGLIGGAWGLFGGGPDQPPMPTNPYRGQWDDLIAQLKQRAAGKGPSMAGDAYNMASANAMHQQAALAAGGSAGAARQAGMNMGQIGQGQAQGYAHARNEEMLGAQNELQSALGGAGSADMNLQNMQMRQWMLQQQLKAQRMAAMSGQLGALGRLAPGKSPSPPSPFDPNYVSITDDV